MNFKTQLTQKNLSIETLTSIDIEFKRILSLTPQDENEALKEAYVNVLSLKINKVLNR